VGWVVSDKMGLRKVCGLAVVGLAVLVGGCEDSSEVTGKLIYPSGNGREVRRVEEVVEDVRNYAEGEVKFFGVSSNCVELVKKFEGFRSEPYPDNGQVAIGYGHCILPGEKFNDMNANLATELLYGDLAWAEKVVSGNVKVSLSQNQYDALCSFVYNVGSGSFEKSTLLKKLNGGDYVGAADEFKRWDGKGDLVIGGLVKRRAEEVALFRKD